jgi:serine/threonine-protein kinase
VNRSATLKAGDKLGQYELLVPIGAGGMGRVWAARERNTTLKPRLVAIKTALAEDGATEGFWKVLFDEGRIASQVTHPNVCSIHQVERERGIVYLVMDWSDGGSLRELLDSLPSHRLEMPMAARIVSRVCSGLHAVHELVGEDGEPLHVVHRDVSPQNVLISTRGQVRITDFGVAKARGQVHAPTQTGEVKGKIAYMAPEQVTTKDVDRRADVFALGCVLYEATIGQRPFSGGDALATLYALLEQPVVPPSQRMPGYPPELEAIVLKALERAADDRYQTAEELGRALEVWLVKQKLSVSDTDIASVLNSTIGERIKVRAKEIDDAVTGIEAPTVVRASPAPQGDTGAAATLGGNVTPMPTRLPVQRSRKGWVFVLAASALVAGGIFAVTRKPGEQERPKAESAQPIPAPITPAATANVPTPAEPATVDVNLFTDPKNAVLYLDGAPVSNPYRATVTRDSNVHKVRAKADGYLEKEEEVVFDKKTTFELTLDQRPVPGRKFTRPAKTSSAPATAPATTQPTQPAQPAQPQPGEMPVIQKKVRKLDDENPFAKKP